MNWYEDSSQDVLQNNAEVSGLTAGVNILSTCSKI